MATVPQAIQMIQFKLGRRRDLDAEIRLMLDNRQRELEKRDQLPWFLAQRISVPLVIADGATYPTHPVAIPAAYIREHEESGMYLVEAGLAEDAETELDKVPMDTGAKVYGEVRGTPEGYSMLGSYLYFWPRPAEAFDIVWDVYAHDTLPSVAFAAAGNSATNLWLTHAENVLIEDVVREMCTILRDRAGADAAQGRFNLAWQLLQQDTIARMEQNNLRTMGEDN